MDNISHGGNVLHCAQFVIGVHDADQRRIGTQGLGNGIHRNSALGIARHVGDGKAFLLQLGEGVQHGRMLNGCGHRMATSISPHGSEYGQIIGFRPAAGEDNFLRTCRKQPRHLSPSLFQQHLGLLSMIMDTRCVAGAIF